MVVKIKNSGGVLVHYPIKKKEISRANHNPIFYSPVEGNS
jgi:hypothetical protein